MSVRKKNMHLLKKFTLYQVQVSFLETNGTHAPLGQKTALHDHLRVLISPAIVVQSK